MRPRSALLFAAIAFLAASPAIAGGAGQPQPLQWVDYVTKLWPIVVTTAGLLATGMLLALATRFASVKALTDLATTVADLKISKEGHETRICALEQTASQSPTRQELQDEIAGLGERMRGVEVGMDGLAGQLRTANEYLHTLIERGLK